MFDRKEHGNCIGKFSNYLAFKEYLVPSHMVLWINSVKYFVYNICFPNHAGWCTEHTKTYVKETGYNC